jgi:hypothetical protein
MTWISSSRTYAAKDGTKREIQEISLAATLANQGHLTSQDTPLSAAHIRRLLAQPA